ncbi:MAG: hypothetical protein L0G89_00275 [Janibacter sp.]|nr:hypothetical protein [Janibacter sp.]
MSAPATARPVVPVEELKRAWQAVQAGQFSTTQAHEVVAPTEPSETTWDPAESVLPVIGCLGGAGATTIALAVAQQTGSARVLECCSATASGLAAAATEEMGLQGGWSVGQRDSVTLQRASTILLGPNDVPLPPEPQAHTALSVVDVGWELGQVLGTQSWLGDQLLHAPSVLVVTTATIPGLRRLEGVLSLLESTRVVAAVIGPRPKKWDHGVKTSMGRLTSRLDDAQNLVEVPSDKTLATHGVDTTPLPPALLSAADHLLRLIEAGTTKKGTQA